MDELGKMTAKQFRAALAKIGLSQMETARLFRVAPRTARHWALRGVKGPPVILLRLLAAGKITIKQIQANNDD